MLLGGLVIVRSTPILARGTFCRFQPLTSDFEKMVTSQGVRAFLEATLRHFSVRAQCSRSHSIP